MPQVYTKASQLFSKIVITSDTAICKKDAQVANLFVFEYHKNVSVTFADQSRIAADTLKIVFDGKDAQPGLVAKKPSTMDRFRDILFKNNVRITSAQRQATADEARFDLKNQVCILEGHV
jgi:lipopolysaccharide export system protein LptA